MVAALRQMFPDCDVTYPLHTHLEIFDAAWHFEHSDATVDIYEKQEIAADLMRAFPQQVVDGTIGSSVYLCGEAYNPQRAWIIGALDSVKLSLMPRFVLPTLDAQRGNANKAASRCLLGETLPRIRKVGSVSDNRQESIDADEKKKRVSRIVQSITSQVNVAV